MSLSFNEIEGAALKGARGAGFAWGLAEEAGYAARWLAERGFDWLPPLLAACDAQLAGDKGDVTIDGTSVSPAAGSRLCPIQIGAWIADRHEIAESLTLTKVRAPLLLLPSLDLLSAHCGTIALALRSTGPGGGASFRICQGELWAEPLPPAELVVDEALAQIDRASASLEKGNVARLARPAPIDPALADRLKALEMRTYVPASHHSRVAGAGAGLTDND